MEVRRKRRQIARRKRYRKETAEKRALRSAEVYKRSTRITAMRHKRRVLDKKIALLFKGGMNKEDIIKRCGYNISFGRITMALNNYPVVQPVITPACREEYKKFISAVKKYSGWRQEVKKVYKDSTFTPRQARIEACKRLPGLHHLLEKYDVRIFDRDTSTYPMSEKQKPPSEIVIEGREQSYRENLRWAIEAAGAFQRTKVPPALCPNNTAYYLYTQAVAEPKEFLSRLGQVELKTDYSEEERQNANKAANRSITEIDQMLNEIESSDAM